MDSDQKVAKKEKVGADGLTKKERRALKVQGKQTQHNSSLKKSEFVTNEKVTNSVEIRKIEEHNIQLKSIERNQPTSKKGNKHVDKNLNKLEITKPTENKNVLTKDNAIKEFVSDIANKTITDKELRKLEWEKKLTEQKAKDEAKTNGSLSKAELKAKRREQQEAQRLAKTEGKVGLKIEQIQNKVAALKEENKLEIKTAILKKEVKKCVQSHKVQLVVHLYVGDSLKADDGPVVVHKNIYPAFVRLGVQYSNKIILGSNARCLALLAALKMMVNDLQTPPKQEFCRYLESVLQTCTNYLQSCRPFAVSMTNALRHFKLQLAQIHKLTNLTDNEKKVRLQDVIDIYINDDIKKAGDAISIRVNEKITKGDVILVYGCSSLIKKILLDAHKDGKNFEVIVVDGRPLLEGKEMLRRLAEAGVKCTYIFINGLSYIMNSVTKVILGAHALLTNGYVMSRIGTAQVALVAQAYNKPVLVCCETYKFSERVQTDSFVYNEIGDPDKLVQISNETSPLNNWKENSKLTPLNLLYDVTPPDLVTAVVTELAILPCTSVPVVLRINANEVL